LCECCKKIEEKEGGYIAFEEVFDTKGIYSEK
jgi:hypothetical protein